MGGCRGGRRLCLLGSVGLILSNVTESNSCVSAREHCILDIRHCLSMSASSGIHETTGILPPFFRWLCVLYCVGNWLWDNFKIQGGWEAGKES